MTWRAICYRPCVEVKTKTPLRPRQLMMERERQGPPLVPISAQLELTLHVPAQRMMNLSPIYPKLTRGCVPKVLKMSSNVSDVFRRSSS